MEPTSSTAYFILVIASLFALLWCIAIVLNIFMLVIFARHSELRTPENVLLINLTIGDFVYLFGFLLNIAPFYDFKKVSCLSVVFCRSFIIAVNTYSVAAISLQRYFALIKFRRRLDSDKTDYIHSLLILASVWVIAIILVAVEILIISQYMKVYLCGDYLMLGDPLYRLIVYGVIPTTIIAVFSLTTANRVNQSVRQIPGVESNATIATLRSRRRRSARVLFALAIVFTLTYIPMFLVLYLSYVYMDTLLETEWFISIMVTTYMMSVLNPLFNPVALCVASRQLRELYKKHCCCCCQQQNASSPSTVTRNTSLDSETIDETVIY